MHFIYTFVAHICLNKLFQHTLEFLCMSFAHADRRWYTSQMPEHHFTSSQSLNPFLMPLLLSSDSHPTNPHNLWTPPRYLVINLTTVTIYYHAVCHDLSGYCPYWIIYGDLWTSDLAVYDYKNTRYSALLIYSASLIPLSEASSQRTGPVHNISHSTHPCAAWNIIYALFLNTAIKLWM